MTLLLIAANMFAAFALLWRPDLVPQFGFNSAAPTFQDAITSLFLHSNLFHLMGNMVFLAAVGPAVEKASAWRFAVVYFVGGLAGVSLHWLFMRSLVDPAPLIGASGAVAAAAAYYSLRYMHTRVPLAPRVSVPVLAVVGLWLGLQILGAVVNVGGSSHGTSYWAHIGGFLTGVLFSFVFRAPREASLQKGREQIEQMELRSPAAVLSTARAHLLEHPNDLSALRSLAAAHATVDDPDNEASVLLELLEKSTEANDEHTVLERLLVLHRIQLIPSLRRTLMAEKLKLEKPDLARRLLLSVAKGPDDDAQRPDALLALASLDKDEPEQQKTWLSELFQVYPLHPACELAKARGWAPWT